MITSVINLSDLNGSNGFVINGIDRGDGSGISVSSAGDVNGDGFDDVIIGAPFADTNGYSYGESYVVFGSSSGFDSSFELSSLDGSNGFVMNGIDSFDNSGRSVSSAGDVNGDGFDDVIIGAPDAYTNGNWAAGESYVVFGSSSGFDPSLELSSLDGRNGFVMNGIDRGDSSGWSVSSAGDVNSDGIDDLIIGAYHADTNSQTYAGESYVVFGSSSGFDPSLNLSDLDGSNGFVMNGINSYERSGRSVSSAGDINGDGFDDVIIGADLAEVNGQTYAGASYVVFGSNSGFDPSFELSSLDGSNGFVINGIDSLDFSGRSVSSAGDFNGDGLGDVIIGATDATNGNDTAGKSYVVFGSSGGFDPSFELSSLDGRNGFVINGIDSYDDSGRSVSSAGDVNGDGFDDLIIGAIGGDPNGQSYAGESYVVFGSSSGFDPSFELSSLDGSNGFVINGIDSGDYSGWSVSSAGDVNGDGIDDLIIGASGASPNGNSSAGESYVVFGFSTNTTPNEINGTSGRDNLTGTDGNDVITGLQSRDTLTGGGGDDIFRYTALVDAGDIIRDFEVGSDKIDLAGVLDSVGFAGVDPIASGYVGFRDRGANTLLTVDPDGSTGSGSPRSFILVQGVSSNLLNNSENFIF